MYQRKDRFYARAKAAGYRSRAAYKLIELDRRFHLLHSRDRVLDLGAWPGGWLQVAAQKAGPQGVVVGVDLRSLDPLPAPVVCVTGDLRDPLVLRRVEKLCGGPVDVVLSDMAPNLSGVRASDEARAAELVDVSLQVAEAVLRPGGRLLVKLFQATLSPALLRTLHERFTTVKTTRPEATRAGSAELYAVALDFRSQTAKWQAPPASAV